LGGRVAITADAGRSAHGVVSCTPYRVIDALSTETASG
jgi:hypothetical protein